MDNNLFLVCNSHIKELDEFADRISVEFNTEVFTASIDLAKYKLDELAIHLNSNQYDSVLEIVEVIHNNYTFSHLEYLQ